MTFPSKTYNFSCKMLNDRGAGNSISTGNDKSRFQSYPLLFDIPGVMGFNLAQLVWRRERRESGGVYQNKEQARCRDVKTSKK